MSDEQSVESIFPSFAAPAPPKTGSGTPNLKLQDDGNAQDTYGRTCSSKTLYQHIDAQGAPFWADEPPENIPSAAEDESTRGCAIIVRRRKSHDPRKSLEIDSIVIQSPLLRAILADVLDGYPDVSLDLERSEIESPFQPLVHRWERLTAALTDEAYDEETRKHLELLHKELGPEIEETVRVVKDCMKNLVVDFEHLWAIFEPGCTILTSEDGNQVAAKFHSGWYADDDGAEAANFVLSGQFINWNGSHFGWEWMNRKISKFRKTKQITSLAAFPLTDDPAHTLLAQNLTKRGKMFESLHGVQYKLYDGQAVEMEDLGFQYRQKLVRVQERVIIDAGAYDRFNPSEKVWLSPIADETEEDPETREINNARYIKYPLKSAKQRAATIPLRDEHHIFCVPLVRGYALKTKRWVKLFVHSVRDITFNDEAFKSLVLPENYKKLLRAFVESQLQFKNDFDDFVTGKGKGVVVLLSGMPGTGKTLTVESVADVMKAPLYSLSAGDLGRDSRVVQQRLDEALQLAAEWNAVLLIDECDVFLEARSTHNLERNELVSIFLRTIEYYEGIMFLTTNRLNSIDPAFHSRVHLSLEYPGLDQGSRKEIWAGFLERIGGIRGGGGHELGDGEVEKLAALDLNGRQIKNVLKTANLLACSEKSRLGFEHVKAVLEIWRYTVQ